MKPDHKEILKAFLPGKALDKAYKTIVDERIQLRITATRSTRLGDFRPPRQPGGAYRISLNHNLNPYQFLITFVHELAHLHVYKKFQNKVQPHGIEWKQSFSTLMQPYFQLDVFPPDLTKVLKNYLINAKAASGTDLELSRCLKQYDKNPRTKPTLEEIPNGSVFVIAGGRVFIKGERLRKRYKCQCYHSKKWYLFSPLAEVLAVDPE